MSWKKKDKELTPEEAVKQAIEETSQYWIRSAPLFVAANGSDGYSLHALNKEFETNQWILILVDPTEISFQAVKAFAEEWNYRYRAFHIGICLIFVSRIAELSNRDKLEDFLDSNKMRFPAVIDHDLAISKALGATQYPMAYLIHGKDTLYEGTMDHWSPHIEEKLQIALRRSDPGLALLPHYIPSTLLPGTRSLKRLAMDARSKSTHIINLNESWVKDGNPFTNFDIQGGKIGLYGKWDFHPTHISPVDESARLYFLSKGSHFCILAQSLSKMIEPAKIQIEINDRPTVDVFADTDIKFDEEGSSTVPIKELRLYHAIKDLDPRSRQTTMFFPNAKRIRSALFEIQFFDLEQFGNPI